MPIKDIVGPALTFAGVALTGWLSYLAGVRKTNADAISQRDKADLDAITVRDASYNALLNNFQAMQSQHTQLVGENAALLARVDGMERRQAERDERERDQISQLAALSERLRHVDACAGGQPCPLAHLRSAHPPLSSGG